MSDSEPEAQRRAASALVGTGGDVGSEAHVAGSGGDAMSEAQRASAAAGPLRPRTPSPSPTRPPPRRRALAGEDFLAFVLHSFGDPERLARLQQRLHNAGAVNGRPFLRAWAARARQGRALEAFHAKLIESCASGVLLMWHRCARRAVIERIDCEIEGLRLDSDPNGSGASLGTPAPTSPAAPMSPREASTHELRIQSLIAALRQSRAAERETAERASEREQAQDALATQLRAQISELKTQLRSAEGKLERARDELRSQSDALSSLCTMYLYKEEEVALLRLAQAAFAFAPPPPAAMFFTLSLAQVKRQAMQQADGGLSVYPPTNPKNPFDLQEPPLPPPLVVQELANLSLSHFRDPMRKSTEVRVDMLALKGPDRWCLRLH